ncbi:MAG TPA: hypothetical protein DD640_08995 [Clostridiales bacterium]|nr:hypothetical protein [Clostridiales bacterium]
MPSIKGKSPALSARLLLLADKVPPCRRLLDIGTDHAWLPIEVISRGVCQMALAIDIRPGPLKIAQSHIRAAGISDRITARQADGLQGISLEPDDVVVLAGLGGNEMMDILGEVPRRCRQILLQPMKSLPELRCWLVRHGYDIETEDLALEKNQVYVVLGCRYTGKIRELDRLEALVGPVLLNRHPSNGYDRYLKKLLAHLHKQSFGTPELLPDIGRIEVLYAAASAAATEAAKEKE